MHVPTRVRECTRAPSLAMSAAMASAIRHMLVAFLRHAKLTPSTALNVCEKENLFISIYTLRERRWIEVGDLVHEGLVVSRSMFLDHVPDNMWRGMRKVRQRAGPARMAARAVCLLQRPALPWGRLQELTGLRAMPWGCMC